MSIRVLAAFGLLALGVWLATPNDVHGCGGAYHPGERVDVADESALIVWDPATSTEHFIRRATFVGTAYDFGFLVPTPTQPQLEPADPELFTELAKITEPRTETRYETDAIIGCGGSAPADKSADLEAALPSGVVVLEQKKVGDLDAAVLAFRNAPGQKPEDAAAELIAWLNSHHYAVRQELREWLIPYIRDKWVITAFKISGHPADVRQPSEGAGSPKRVALKAASVRMSFKTDRPFFPYREPADQHDTRATNAPRLLRVYFAATQRMAGNLGRGPSGWPGKTVWANAITDAEHGSMLAKAKLPAETAPAKWWITEFEDRSSPRPGTDDVYFAPSVDQTPIARQPHVLVISRFPWWSLGICFAMPFALFMGIMFLSRRIWKRT